MISIFKRCIFLLAVLLVLGSCKGQSDSAGETAAVDTVEQPSEADVVKRVNEIYDAVFKEYNREDSLRNLDKLGEDPGAFAHWYEFIDNYCSSEWGSLVRKVAEIDSLYHKDDLGFWEADYWIMGQDWHNLSISDVKVLSMAGSEAVVEFLLHNFDSAKPVTLKMVKEDGLWRIDNFKDNEVDMDWKRSLHEYVTEETAKNEK